LTSGIIGVACPASQVSSPKNQYPQITDYIAKSADQLSSLAVILEIATLVMARLLVPG